MIFWIFFLILSVIVEVYLWWKLQSSLIFLSGRTCTIGGWLNTFLPHCKLLSLLFVPSAEPSYPSLSSFSFLSSLLPQDCPVESGDFRAQQCSAHNDIRYQGMVYEWIPVPYEPSAACALRCQARGRSLTVELAPKVLDGTRCRADALDMCISGVCQVRYWLIVWMDIIKHFSRGSKSGPCTDLSGGIVFCNKTNSSSQIVSKLVTVSPKDMIDMGKIGWAISCSLMLVIDVNLLVSSLHLFSWLFDVFLPLSLLPISQPDAILMMM